MTATILENGVDTTEDNMVDLSEDEAVPCDGCEQEAEYHCMAACCGAKILLCSDCLINIKNNLIKTPLLILLIKNLVCDFCKTQVFTPDWLIVIGKLKD